MARSRSRAQAYGSALDDDAAREITRISRAASS